MSIKKIKYFISKHRVSISTLCLLTICTSLYAYLEVSRTTVDLSYQVPQKQQSKPKEKTKLIEIRAANVLSKTPNTDYQTLLDSVIFYHDGAFLYCDSAHFNEKENNFDAFGNVMMEQGDTLFLYGSYMHYDGNMKIAKVRNNVRLEHNQATLFTDSLNYDRMLNIGYYFDGGLLVDERNADDQNELTSYWGQYEPSLNLATFKDSVKLENSRFTLYSDILLYNTNDKVAKLVSPSIIVSDSGTIYTSNGKYNTVTDVSELYDQSVILNKEESRILKGDTIFYDKMRGVGEVFGNMFLQDTINKVILRGNYGYYEDNPQYAMAMDSAYVVEYSQGDTLYLHADTLKMKTDSIFKDITAYHGVRFYRSDMQGVSDSMIFNSRDSVLHLYRDPIIWNENNQIFGDTIDVFMNDSTIDYIDVKKNTFSIEQIDSIYYNQLKGRSLRAFLEDGKVKRVLVEGNAESIFYPQEKDKSFVGHNWLEGSYLEIFLDNGKLDKLKVWPQPKGKMTPLDVLPPDQLRLKDFYWYDYIRPVDKDDIFRKVSKKFTDIRPTRSSIFDRQEDE